MTTQNNPIVAFGKHKDMSVYDLVQNESGYCDWVLGLEESGQSSNHVHKLCVDIKNCKQIISSGLMVHKPESNHGIHALKYSGTATGSLPQKKKKFPSGGVVGADGGMSYASAKDSIAAVLSKGDAIPPKILVKGKKQPDEFFAFKATSLGAMIKNLFPDEDDVPPEFMGKPLDALIVYRGSKDFNNVMTITATMYDRDTGIYRGGVTWLN